jgi:DNA-binding CsgD family transcriptional regulator
MPESADLHIVVHGGQTTVLVGNTAVASYADGDLGMRNTTVVTLTNLGFAGVVVAEKMGLTPEYVSELRGNARRHGSAGLMQKRGRPPKMTPAQVTEARRCAAGGMLVAEIARRFSVDHKTAAKAVAGVQVAVQPEMDLPAPRVRFSLSELDRGVSAAVLTR